MGLVEEQSLKQLAKLSNVTYHNLGFMSNEDLNYVYNLADVYVSPSLCEGFDLPLLEAMACGTPVIASNNSSHPEVVGKAGSLLNLEVDLWVDRILLS